MTRCATRTSLSCSIAPEQGLLALAHLLSKNQCRSGIANFCANFSNRSNDLFKTHHSQLPTTSPPLLYSRKLAIFSFSFVSFQQLSPTTYISTFCTSILYFSPAVNQHDQRQHSNSTILSQISHIKNIGLAF
jgi:hypothetical protein